MQENRSPWASFCISTYKRHDMLLEQVKRILKQTFTDFEIVISDNDPESTIGTALNFDPRIRYFRNEANLGMVRSFNASIQRATGEYVVMITDDDPVEEDFLSEMFALKKTYPGRSIYAGFLRKTPSNTIEDIRAHNVIIELLDMNKTPAILWSSCVMKRKHALKNGGMPDYGSPHLADHAMIVMVGSIDGVVVKNNMFSFIQKHENNFSKFNFKLYVEGCDKFYKLMTEYIQRNNLPDASVKAVEKHIIDWFRVSYYDLKKFYLRKNDSALNVELENFKKNMFGFKFIQERSAFFHIKGVIFNIKKLLRII